MASRNRFSPKVVAVLTIGLTVLAFLVGVNRPMKQIYASEVENGISVYQEDTKIYQRDVARVQAGELVWRDFNVEYPPLSPYVWAAMSRGGAPTVQAFTLRMIPAGSVITFFAFAFFLASGWPSLALGRIAFLIPLTVLAILHQGWLYYYRFDGPVAAVTLVALGLYGRWWRTRSPLALGGAFALLSLATTVKLYPGLILAAAAVPLLFTGKPTITGEPTSAGSEDPRRRRTLLIASLSVALAALPTLILTALGTTGAKAFVDYHSHRHLEMGSLPASLAWYLNPSHQVAFGFGSIELRSPLESVLLPLSTLGTLLLSLFPLVILVRRARRGSLGLSDVLLGGIASVFGFIILNKVFSPQYAIWLFFLIPSLGFLPLRRCLPLALALTAVSWVCGWQMAPGNFAWYPSVDLTDAQRVEHAHSAMVILIKNSVALVAYAIALITWLVPSATLGKDAVDAGVAPDPRSGLVPGS